MSSSGFYRDFEDRHRGSSELIRSRLCVYRPFVEPLRFIYEKSSAIDLGCGRGEWLGLLQEWGFDAQGVDLDDDMLSACRTRGLKVQTGDAVAFLKSLPNASQVIVSGFHLAEHISFVQLQKLISQALRVLKPGGLLILETPNPENVVVGTTNFYLDPTHKRPIPPLLLAFLPEYYGYDRVKILRLQEAPDLVVQENVSLIDVFAGVSPDYAVVAQKKGGPEILDAFCGAFDKAHGLELRDLANRYDSALDRRLAELSQRIGNAESQAGGMSDALARIADLQDRLVDAVLQAERNAACAQIAENTVAAAENRAHEQEQRALVAENRAYEQEQRTLAAENRAHEQEQRALAAENRAHEQEQRALAAENRAHKQEQRALAAESLAHEQAIRIDELGCQAHHWWQQASNALTCEQAFRESLSWKVTAPLRLGLDAVYLITRRKNFAFIHNFSIRSMIVKALGKPRLVATVHGILKPFPPLHAYVTQKVTNIVIESIDTAWSAASTQADHKNENKRLLFDRAKAGSKLSVDEILARIQSEIDGLSGRG